MQMYLLAWLGNRLCFIQIKKNVLSLLLALQVAYLKHMPLGICNVTHLKCSIFHAVNNAIIIKWQLVVNSIINLLSRLMYIYHPWPLAKLTTSIIWKMFCSWLKSIQTIQLSMFAVMRNSHQLAVLPIGKKL